MKPSDRYNVKKQQMPLPLLDGLFCQTSIDIIPSIDINALVIDNPSASFYAKVSGDSMINVGI